MCETGETMIMIYEQTAKSMVGRNFKQMQSILLQKGYVEGKLFRRIKECIGIVYFTKGKYENRSQYRITFEWIETAPGIMEPGKIISSKWIKPMVPEPFELVGDAQNNTLGGHRQLVK